MQATAVPMARILSTRPIEGEAAAARGAGLGLEGAGDDETGF